MTDYRLDQLGPRLFEHIIQSLAIGAISTTVAPFGDGPDGGREATFDGPTHYGSEGAYWHGRGIIQAKYHVRAQSPSRDAAWARTELKKELKQYDRKTKPRPAAEYFIYAVNVVLSPGAGQGRDSVQAILDDFKQRHNLKAVEIWDYDKLRTLIDRDEAVRNSYMAWILPSDVLAALCAKLRTGQRDYYPLIIRYLQREMVADQYAKLEQAGHSADDAIPLSQVFIDLPTSTRPPSSEDPNELRRDQARFVARVISDAGQSFKAVASDEPEPQTRPSHLGRGVPGRYVLIGGPGQGKTTVGQYVCQIFRHALLADVPRHLLSHQASTALQGFTQQWRDAPSVPRARRLPFRIVLGDLARSLAEREATSLPEYLALRFCANSPAKVSGEEIERILAEYPSVIVLDGLDEVPSSTNREALMSAVSGFLIDVAAGGLDVLLLATSRPQGYNDDFSPHQYMHHYLLPLSPQDALKYGCQLARVRFGDANERYSKVTERLERAMHNPATARLMETPLQVTILTLLVDRIGTPPEERWALFSAYYKLIFERETERGIESVAVLKTNAVDIDEIHRRVGLALQVESERSGGTDARLTVEQFSDIVDSYLAEEGHLEPQRANLKNQIIEAAGNRLVFLVGLESGQVGFEIRSLQEFMAAEGLMADPDAEVQDRLREVAASTNWRNVFLFAAGQCFAKRRYLRDTIEAICIDLNDDENESLRKLRVGSSLALELLEDGPARKQPIKRRSLTRLAVQLLALPQQEVRRLARISEEDTLDIFEEQIRDLLQGEDIFRASSAWSCLVALVELHGGQFERLGQEVLARTPLDGNGFHSALVQAHGRSEWLSTVLLDYIRQQGPVLDHAVNRTVYREERERRLAMWPGDSQPPWLVWFGKYSDMSWQAPEGRRSVRLIASPRESVELRLNSLAVSREQTLLLVPPPESPTSGAWQFFQAAGRFCSNPSRETLAEAVTSYVAVRTTIESPRLPFRMYPWPLAECMYASTRCPAGEVISVIESGAFGDHDQWSALEEHWREGVAAEELVHLPPVLTGPDGTGLLYTFPFRSSNRVPGVEGSPIGQALQAALDASTSPLVRDFLAEIMVYSTRSRRHRGGPPRVHAVPWVGSALMALLASHKPYIHPMFFDRIEDLDLTDPAWSWIFSAFSPMALVQRFPHPQAAPGVTLLREAIEQEPSLEGLVVPLAVAALDNPDTSQRRIIGRSAMISETAGPAVQLAAVVLDIISGLSIGELSHRIAEAVGDDARLMGPILTAILARDLPYEGECEALMDAMAISSCSFADWFSALGSNFLRRRSRLGDPRIWSDLRLPQGVLEVLS